ncbi:nucleoside-diphosphate kinase [Salisediminibacterium beveridgei]|uniref:Nucleoside diphosphate kinase n=1 Tax=Salisediminibacterium beveridgei TaxID=632773 RepID=A0A1D7QUX2_9BACI|nr:nucleoside-diphosphate kinase [Salisediminibacterium beveridgei]AOM82805.1 Nucleoside diphosphate kinase [Salisediminibacterium beveridgei]
MEQTYLMIKPDGVSRKLTGELINRFEKKGFTLRAAKMITISEELAKEHYGEHADKPFFPGLINFITSGPVFAMVLEGNNVIKEARKMMGATNPEEASPGTIRGDFATEMSENIIHGSDSKESAKREINLFFPEL